MSSYGRNFSTRLFIQAAFTGFLAPLSAGGSAWLMVTFVLAGAAAVVGAVVRSGHEKTRELVIGFEAVAVAVGAVGLAGHHYIPGTIVGIAALVTALNHPMPRPVAVPAQATPVDAAPAPQFAAPAPAADVEAAAHAPVPDMATPVTAPVTGVRAMDILPGR